MPSYTPAQKRSIKQFVEATSVKESTAVKSLKAAGWNIAQAVDGYFGTATTSPVLASTSKSDLNKLFDSFRDEASASSPDTLYADATMRYLQSINVGLEESALLAVLTQVEASTLGELSREQFVAGWERCGATTLLAQRSQVQRFRTMLTADPDFFKAVYRHSFNLARVPGQKSAALDTAIEFWRMLFSTGGLEWRTPSIHGVDGADGVDGVNWLDCWVEFLQEKWKKSVGKDLWDQTLLFARKTLEDPHLGFWNSESAWPSVIDDFVEYMNEKRGIKS